MFAAYFSFSGFITLGLSTAANRSYHTNMCRRQFLTELYITDKNLCHLQLFAKTFLLAGLTIRTYSGNLFGPHIYRTNKPLPLQKKTTPIALKYI